MIRMLAPAAIGALIVAIALVVFTAGSLLHAVRGLAVLALVFLIASRIASRSPRA